MTFKNPDFSANSPYYDDFQDTKNFLKILFKPGYAVQARELTQLQSILQSQVATFADHIFQNGSQVFGGNVQITETPYVRVETFLYNQLGAPLVLETTTVDTYFANLPSNLLKVYEIVNGNITELATIKVIYTEPTEHSIQDPFGILYYNVVSVADGVESGTFEMQSNYFIGLADENIETPILLKVIDAEVSNTIPAQNLINPIGIGYLVTVDEGIFYVDGYFIKTEKQTIALYKNSVLGESEQTLEDNILYDFAVENVRLFNVPSHRVGFEVVRTVVTASDDETLKDPARGFYNFNAPGADRYKISLVLKAVEYNFLSVDLNNYVNDDFIQIIRTTRGVVDYIKNKSSYSQILELFARRTHDESGSYTVTPFLADVKNHLRNDRYIFSVVLDETPEKNNLLWKIKIGSYLWTATNSSSGNANVDPFEINFNPNNLNTALGKVVSIIKDYDVLNANQSQTERRILKLVVNLANNKKFGPVTGNSVTYYFKQPNSSAADTLKISRIDTEIDSKGAFSLVDIPSGDPEKTAITLQPGKAYIHGYEFETFAPRTLEYLNNGNKNETKILKGLNVNYDLGNYIYGSFSKRDQDQSEVNFETLPLLELVDKNVHTLLIYPSSVFSVSGTILSWSPFKASDEFNKYDEKETSEIVDFDKIFENSEVLSLKHPHESVIFVELDD